MTHGSEWDMEIWRPEVENVTRGRNPTNDCVSYVLSYDQDGGVGVFPTRWWRFCLPTRWWHGRIAYKMAAIQNKQNVNKNNVEYVLCLQCRIYLVNVMWPPDSSMSDVRHWTVWRSTVTWWTFDSAQRHMMAFWPISEAARSWSCDKITCLCVMTGMSFWHQRSCWTELPAAFTTQITATSSTVLYSSRPVRWCRQRFYSIIITIASSLSQ